MQTVKKKNGVAWLVFFISLAAFFLSIFFHFEYLTLILPVMLTAFVLAMDII